MSLVRLVAACVFLGMIGGCGHKPAPPEAKDPAVYARTIKHLVLDFVEEGNRSPVGVPKQAAVLLETLEVYKTQPVGEHEAIYAQLTERCRELTRGADQQKLNDMAALAKKLPG